MLKKYYACKDSKGMYKRRLHGTLYGSYVLETKYLFANERVALEYAEKENLRVVGVNLTEIELSGLH